MTITLNALQKQRRDTASNWTTNITVLLAGELGYETDTKKFKIGDGTTAWQSLDYLPIPDTNRLLAGNLTVGGNFTVNGTTTTIDTTTLTVEDKNIEIGKVSTPSDTTADGGGITLKGATDKTINWVDSTDSWTLSEHLDLATGKVFKINNAEILSATTLGSSVVNSSLTSVGTIATGVWNGTAIDISKISGAMPLAGGTFTDDVTFTGASYSATWDKSDNALEFADNAKAVFGAENDLQIYHDGNHSRIVDTGTGDLKLQTNFLSIVNADNTEILGKFIENGAVELYHGMSGSAAEKKFETTSTGLKSESSSNLNIHLLKTGAQDTLIQNTGQTEICAATGGASGQRIVFRIGANTGSMPEIARFTPDGLCFGSDTAAANALEDYEEGTWNPTVTGGVDGTAQYATRAGWYTKIGRLVQASFVLVLINASTGSTGDGTHLYFGGLPFNSAFLIPGYSSGGTVTYTTMSMAGSDSQIVLFVGNNSDTVYTYRERDSQGTLTTGANDNKNKSIYGVFTYMTA